MRGCRDGQGGPRTLKALRRIVRGVVLGLHHLHVEGVVHRDLKPENVVLSSQGHPVLIDFEHSVDSTLATLRTAPGGTAAVGTLGYMAPELLQGQPASAASDIFALGKIVEALCRAWERARDSAGPGRAVKAPSELLAVAARMLRQDPKARPTAMDLLATPLLSGEWGAEQESMETGRALRYLQASSAMRRMVRRCLLFSPIVLGASLYSVVPAVSFSVFIRPQWILY
jgi:serine/threonine protein kinase